MSNDELAKIAIYEADTDQHINIEATKDIDRWGSYHFHRQIELYYVILGKKIFFLDGKKYILKKGDVIFVNSFSSHLPLPDKESSRQYLIKLPEQYCASLFSYMKGKKLKTPYLPAAKTAELQPYFHTIVTEYKTMNPLVLQGNIDLLLGKLVDLCGTEECTNSISGDIIEQIINFIHENYKRDLNLKTLSEKFNYSPCYFSRFFNDIFGIGLSEFVAYTRLIHTIETYNSSICSISEAAFYNGFKSLQTFYRILHKYYGDDTSILQKNVNKNAPTTSKNKFQSQKKRPNATTK